MVSTSGFGIGGWALTTALAVLPASGATPPGPIIATSSIDVSIHGLRNDRGVVRLVLCPKDGNFPDCSHGGMTQVAAIQGRGATASFRNVVPGAYAIAVFHDENDNGRLDTFLGIPREGFGFSRNPPVRPRAPHFSECDFTLVKDQSIVIAMKYLF